MPFQHGLVPCRRVTLEHVGQEYLLLQSSQAGLQGKAFSSSGKFQGSHAVDGSCVASLLIAELWQTVLSAASVSI